MIKLLKAEGLWSGTFISCRRAMKSWLFWAAVFLQWIYCSSQRVCEEPPDIDFAEIVSEKKATYLENDRVQYRCNPGYVLEGSEWILCNGEEWTPPLPKCLAPCSITKEQLATENLFLFGGRRRTQVIQSNRSLIFQCSEEYILTVPSVRKCVDGHMDLPLCISKSGGNCSGPPRIENGDIITLSEQQYRSGSSVEFKCQIYYAMEGQNRSFCDNGTWTKVPICLDPCMIPRAELESQKIEVKEGMDVSENIYMQRGHSVELTCRTGYVLAANPSQSDSVIHCDGTPPVIPKCKEITCNPPRISNGSFRPQRTIYHDGDLLRIQCDRGFSFETDNGEKMVECTRNGWSPSPKCVGKGCDYIQIENGRMSNYYEWNKPFPRLEGQLIDFYCYRGFLPENKQTWLRAKCINSRFVPEPKCFKICDPPPRFHYGHFINNYQNNYIEGDNITFACDEGYYPAEQQSTARCTKNGWSPVPRCIQRVEHTCEKVPLPRGYFALWKQHYQINEEARYVCHDGYTTPEGGTEGQTRCLKEGWIPKPNCIKTCSKPRADTFILNTTKPVFLSGDELQYECKEGFETIKKTIGDTVVCSEEGWEPTPACLPIECETPFLDNGMIDPREDKFLHKMVVHFKCRTGFTRVGSESAQCYHFGWSPQPAICKENVKPCQASPSILHGIINDLKEVYQHGENLEVQCNISFALYGSKIIECVDGEWAPLPSCIEEVKTCGPPPKIRKGTAVNVKSTSYRHGETVEYQCQPLSIITGTNPAKCLHGQWEVPSCLVNPRKCTRPSNAVFQPDVTRQKQFKNNELATYLCGSNLHETKCVEGVWFPEPLCKETCPPPPQLPNAINIAEMRIYRSGEEISFRCKQHFFLHGPQKIKCEDGKWQTPPRCLDLRCSPPPEIDNGVVKISNRTTFFPGESVEYRCCSGFETDQINSVKCENRKWSKPPVCKEKSCGVPPAIPNASLEQEDRERYESGEIINYTCNLGFDATEPTSKTCKRGQWMGSFTCEDTTCPEPPPVEDAEIVEHRSKKYLSGQKINYQCNDGFEISGSATVTCTEKKWLHLPRCEDIRCPPPPQLQNGQMNGVIKERYLPMEKVSYRCRQGYSLLGSPFITCSKKRWTETPRCADIAGRCGRPPPVDNGDILETPKANYNTRESVTYKCQSLYKMEGSPRVTCQNGHWSQTPTCIAPCTASEEDMRQHNIRLKWKPLDKIYSEDGNMVEFVCIRNYQPHPNSGSFRVPCVEGKFHYPHCTNF